MKQQAKTHTTFAAALTAFMDERNIETRQLAIAYNCSDGYISQIRSGKVNPTWMTMLDIIKAANTLSKKKFKIELNEEGLIFK